MRKSTKIAAIVAAAALLVLGMAFTSMAAAKGWTEEGGVWVWLDKDGERVTECWKPGADGAQYWLDENGEMATEQKIDDGNYTYYVGADGKMAKNFWLAQDGEDGDPETVYYYFGSNGRAYKNTGHELAWKTIDGGKYAFNGEGKMLSGWLKKSEIANIDTEDNENWKDCEFYCGKYNSGKRVTAAWKQIDVWYDGDAEYKTKWFYFGGNGEKYATDGLKNIGGKKYFFDEFGVMQTGIAATPAEEASSGNYYFDDNGARLVKDWVWKVPTAAQDPTDHDEETSHWFYAGADGQFKKSVLAKIGGKYYAFKPNGAMLSGLYALEVNPTTKAIADGGIVAVDTEEKYTYWTTLGGAQLTTNYKLYFFGEEKKDGSMKTGTVKVDVDGEEKTMKFSTKKSERGQAINGIDGGAWYTNGAKLAADGDMKYQILIVNDITVPNGKISDIDLIAGSKLENISTKYTVAGTVSDKVILVSSTGAIIKTGTKTDGEGFQAKVENYLVTKITKKD